MSYLRTPADSSLYETDRAAMGYVPNYTKVFALAPEVYATWQTLAGTIKEGMDLRRYELATLAAARQLRSSYCGLAHGKVLRDRFYDAGTVRAIATDHTDADLNPADVAVIDFAGRVAGDASAITAADIDELREHGLSDEEIFQVVLATAARCFFSTVLDAVGTEPDVQFRTSLDPELRESLTFGRPVAES